MTDQSTQVGEEKKQKPGILRLDISKPRPRRSSGGSVEFRSQPELLGEVSPSLSGTTSPPQLSVTWASQCEQLNLSNNKQMQNYLKSPLGKNRRIQLGEERPGELSPDPTSPLDETEENNSEDEDYSLSVSAIMQRRASIRGGRKKSRSSRRMSSPMDQVLEATGRGGDRRRSSVYTTSSGDTAISLDDGTNQDSTQEQIYENIRLHKEVIQSVKYQPWSMRRKLKLVHQAKVYVARHEGALQERFAMSRSTKDLWARFKILMATRWRHWKREMASYLMVLIPWELRIKQIESHFGSSVASYFTFLRWLLWVNIMIAIPLLTFVIIPELLATDPNIYDKRKKMTKGELKIAGNILTIWEFDGYLKYSPLFYGFYSHFSGAVQWGYNLPLAYFLTAVTVYIYSFVAILKKMAENSRTSKLSLKDDECDFSWKLFIGWDFMIGHAETAHNRIASVVVGFKEALLEEAEKKRDKRNWRIILQRILVNILIIVLLAASGYTIVFAVDRSENAGPNATWLRRNELNIIMTLLSFFLPMMFEALGLFEKWHPRKQLRFQLARIMILNLLNLYSLMFSFIYNITGKDESIQRLKDTAKKAREQKKLFETILKNITTRITEIASTSITGTFDNGTESSIFPENITDWMSSAFPDTSPAMDVENQTHCTTIYVNCSKPRNYGNKTLTTSLLLLNLSTTILPDFWNRISESSSDISLPNYDDNNNIHMNDSYFDYYDYFENFVEEPLVKAVEGSLGNASPRRNRYAREAVLSDIDYNKDISYNQEHIGNISKGINYSYVNIANIIADGNHIEESANITEEFVVALSKFIENVTTNGGSNQRIHWNMMNSKLSELILQNSTPAIGVEEYDTDSYEEEGEDNCTKIVCFTLHDVTTPSVDLNDVTSTQSLDMFASSFPKESTELSLEDDVRYYEEALRNVSNELKEAHRNLTKMCWETSLGQELSKVIVFDMIMSIAAPLCIDFLRALFVRYVNEYWCWDMEKTFPQYGDFKIAESILNLVYNQGQVWMGIFFSPGLVIINIVKLIILMYLRSWIVLTCNVPHELVFKASKSNNFYLSLLLTMLFLCVLPVGYAVVWLRPSWRCGPFSKYERISQFFTNTTIEALPSSLHKPLEYMTSSSTVIPLLLLLILIIYYLISLTNALRDANQDLRNQLQKERMEERKKMFKPREEKPTEQNVSAISARWKKVLEASSPVTPPGPGVMLQDIEESKMQARKELLSRIMKRALRKGSGTSDDETNPVRCNEDDETDTEHHDSLPHDEEAAHRTHKVPKNGKKFKKPSILDIIQLAKKEKIKEPHPNELFKVDKEIVADTNDNDPDTNMRIVSERRKSLLRRQQNIDEFHSQSHPDDDKPKINYEIVHEKNKDIDKIGGATKGSLPQSVEPQVFKFDNKSVENGQQEHLSHKKRFSSNIFFKRSISSEPEREPSTEDIHQIGPSEKVATLSKGRKKLGSFLALVKEAVNTKKGDDEQASNNEFKQKQEPVVAHHIEKSKRVDVAIPIKVGSEEKDKIEEDKQVEEGAVSRTGSQKKFVLHRQPKREDSESSIWSDNIPVITISKTGSEECILENSDTETNGKSKSKSKSQSKREVI